MGRVSEFVVERDALGREREERRERECSEEGDIAPCRYQAGNELREKRQDRKRGRTSERYLEWPIVVSHDAGGGTDVCANRSPAALSYLSSCSTASLWFVPLIPFSLISANIIYTIQSHTVDIPQTIKDALKKFRFARRSAGSAALVIKINKAKLIMEEDEQFDSISIEELAEGILPPSTSLSVLIFPRQNCQRTAPDTLFLATN